MEFYRRELKSLINMLNSDSTEDNNIALEIVNTHFKNNKKIVKHLIRKSKLDIKYIYKNGVVVGKEYIIGNIGTLWSNY